MVPITWLRRQPWSALLASFTFLAAASSDALGENQRFYRSAYFLGRGDTGIAIADDHEAIFYNPAGLAQGKGIYKETVLASPMVEVSTATKDLVRKAALENSLSPETLADEIGKNQHLGVYNFSGIVFRRAALGAATSSQTNFLPKLAAEQRGLPVLGGSTYTNQLMTFSLAESYFGGAFAMGVTGKYIANRTTAAIEVPLAEAETAIEALGDSKIVNSASGGGADLGMMFKTSSKRSPFSLGLTIENAGNVSMKGLTPEDQVDPILQTINVGMALEPGTQFSRIRLLLDVRDLEARFEENILKRIHMGAEISIRSVVGLMTGFNQGYPTFGFYVDLYALRFDMGTYTEEMGQQIGERPDQRIFFRLKLGF